MAVGGTLCTEKSFSIKGAVAIWFCIVGTVSVSRAFLAEVLAADSP